MHRHKSCNQFTAAIALASGLCFALAQPVLGQTTNFWTNEVNGMWNAATNWSPGVPVSSTNTILQFNADATDSYRASNNFAGTFLLNCLIFNSSSTGMNVLNGGALQLTAGTLGGPQLLQNGSGAFQISNDLALAADTSIGGPGAGDLTLGGAISGSGGLIKSGAFRLIVTGSNGYTGATVVSNGVFEVRHSAALGDIAAGTTVASGAALELNNNVTIGGEALNLNGAGIANGGALRSAAGSNTYGGAITLAGATRVNADAGSVLVLNSATGIGGAGQGLTVGGAGNTLVLSSIDTGSGTFTKDGTGRVTLGASNSFTGATTISNGVLTLQNSFALGDTAAGTSVRSSAALELQNSVAIGAEALNVVGTGVANGGALRSVTGSNSYGGAVTLAGATRINADAGSVLVLNSATPITGAGQGLTVGGAGNATILSPIATGGGSFSKDGTGTVTLAGSNSYTGATVVGGGTLVLSGIDAAIASSSSVTINARAALTLDNLTSINSNRINNGAALTMNGGTFNFINAADNATGLSERLGALSVGAGANTINAQPSAGNSILTFTSLGRTATAAINFAGDVLGSSSNQIAFSNAPVLDDGIIGGWATVNLTDFATYTNGSVAALPAAGYNIGAPTNWSFTQNVKVSSNLTLAGTSGANRRINSLNLQRATPLTLNLGGAIITNESGGLLVSGGTGHLLTNGSITAGPNAAGLYELVTIVSNGVTFTNFAVITTNGANPVSTVFAGPGTTILRGNNTYTGNTFINNGVLSINSSANLGFASNALTISGDGTLQISAGFTQPRVVNLGPGGGHVDVTGANIVTQSGLIGNGAETLAKEGTGTLIITSTNSTRTGPTFVNGGLLRFDNPTAFGGNLPATAITVNGGTLGYNSATILLNTVVLGGGAFASIGGNRASDGPVIFTGTNASTLSLVDAGTPTVVRNMILGGQLSGAGNVNVTGGSNRATLTLTNILNSFSGRMTVGSNVMLISSHTNGSTLGAGTIELRRGSLLSIRHNGYTDDTIAIRTNATILFSNNIVVTGDSQIETFRVNANGAAVTNYTAFLGFDIASSRLTLSNFNSYGFKFLGTSAVSGASTINTALGAGLVPVIFNGPISDGTNAGSLTLSGGGLFFFTNVVNSTYSGGTVLDVGNVTVFGGTNTNTAAFVTTPLGTGPITLKTGVLRLLSDTNQIFGSGPGYNIDARSNSVVVLDRRTVAGGVNRLFDFGALGLSSNGLVINQGNNFMARFGGAVTLNGDSRLTNNADLIFNGPITDNGSNYSFTKIGTNRIFITNLFDSTYSGGTYIGQGGITVAGGTNTNTAAFVTLPLGTGPITLTNASLIFRSDTNQIFGPGAGYPISLIGPAAITMDRTSTNALNNTFQIGSLNLGPNVLTLTSSNGAFLAVNAPLTLSNSSILGGGGLQFNDTLTLAGSNNLTGTYRLLSNAVMQGSQIINAPGNVIFNGLLNETTPGSTLTKLGAGTLFFTNLVNNNYSGPTYISGGGLQLAGNGTTNLPVGTNFISLDAAALNLRSLATQTFGAGNGYSVIVSNASTINVDRYAGAIANGLIQLGQLTHNGGTLTITGGNTFNVRIDGPTTLNGLAGFAVTDTRSVNPFSLLLAGPIVEGTPGSILRKLGPEMLGYTNLAAPTHTGGTIIENGFVSWRPTNLLSGGYQFGSGPIRLDGGGLSAFAFQQDRSNNYVLSNNFVVTASVQNGGGLTNNGGGMLDFTAQGTGRPFQTNTGTLTVRGPLVVTAGAAGSYSIVLAPLTFTGAATVANGNQRLSVNGSGGGTGNHIVFTNAFGSDGVTRNLIVTANNNSGIEFGGNNSAFAGAFQIRGSYAGANGRVLFNATNALPAGGVDLGLGTFAALGPNFATFGLSNAISKFTFGTNSVLGLTFTNALPLDLSPAGLNKDARLGAPDGYVGTIFAPITPFGSTFNLGGGGGTLNLTGTNLLRDGISPRRLSVNVVPQVALYGNGLSVGITTISQSNSFTGGTVLNGGTFNITTGRANTPLGTGQVDTYGLIIATGSGSFANASGLGNNNLIVTHPGSEVRLDSAGTFNTNRYGDTSPLTLNGAILQLIGRTAANNTNTELIGDLTFAAGSQLTLNISTNTNTFASLTVNSVNRSGRGTLQLNRVNGSLGVSNFLFVSTGAPASQNGMVAPYIVSATDNTFVDYGPGGFTNTIYSASPLTAATGTDVVSNAVPVTLAADTTVYALRSSQPVSAGASSNLTIRSGGFIAAGTITNTGLNMIFGDTGTSEALLFVQSGLTLRLTNTTIAASSLTKFGDGTLRLESGLNYANGWNINRGVVALGTVATNGLGATTAGNIINLNGSVTLQLSATATPLTYSGGRISTFDFNTITTDFGGQSDRVQSYASGLELNSISNGPLGAILRVNESGSRNLFNILGPTTLNADASLVLVNSTFPITGGSNRLALAGGLTAAGRTLNKYGSGTLMLPTDNRTTFTGGTIQINAGVLAVTNNGSLGNAASTTTIAPDAVLELLPGLTNFTPVAALNQMPGSAERWAGEFNRFSRNTNFETYTMPANVHLQLATNFVTLSNKTIRLNGGTIEAFQYLDDLRPAGFILGSGVTLELAADSTIGQSGVDIGRNGVIFTNNANITESGGSRSLTKIGADTVLLNGNLVYTGDTIIKAGTLRMGRDEAMTNSTRLVVTNLATFDLNNFNQTLLSLQGDGNVINSSVNFRTFRLNNTDSSWLGGAITGRVNVVKQGAGSLTLSGQSSFTGTFEIRGGDVLVGASAFGPSSPLGGATNGAVVMAGPARILTVGPHTVARAITVEDSLFGQPKVIGGNTAHNSRFTGDITIIDTPSLTAAAGGRVDFDGVIQQSGGVFGITKDGPGTVSLNRWNTFGADVTVNEGTLLVNNGPIGSATGTGSVTVNPGATLGGSGRMSGPVVIITDGAFLSPGNSAGALRIDNDLSLSSLSKVTFEIGGLIQTNGYDFVSVGGFADLHGEIELKLISSFLPPTNTTFTLMQFGSTGSTFDNVFNGQRLTTSDNLGSFKVNYTASAVTVNQFRYTDSDADGVYDAWALRHFGVLSLANGTGPTDRFGDFDGDGLNNYGEFIAGMVPTNSASVFKVTTTAVTGTSSFVVQFTTAEETGFRTQVYKVQYSSDLVNWTTVSAPVLTVPAPGLAEWVDDGTQTGGTPPLDLPGPRFYRVQVQ